MAEIWFSSDQHFRHENTWRRFKAPDGSPLRPFTSTKEMDQCMIDEHNKLVKPSDHWYCLGDISMMRPRFVHEQVEAMHGHKRLIRGNHDIFKTKEYMEVGFEEIYGMRYVDGLCFTHYPIHPHSVGRYAANVHGHVHTGPNLEPARWTRPEDGEVWVCPYLNITVEHTNYRPLSLGELKEMAQKAKEAALNEPTTTVPR